MKSTISLSFWVWHPGVTSAAQSSRPRLRLQVLHAFMLPPSLQSPVAELYYMSCPARLMFVSTLLSNLTRTKVAIPRTELADNISDRKLTILMTSFLLSPKFALLSLE